MLHFILADDPVLSADCRIGYVLGISQPVGVLGCENGKILITKPNVDGF